MLQKLCKILKNTITKKLHRGVRLGSKCASDFGESEAYLGTCIIAMKLSVENVNGLAVS